jgi:hypothetical protein
LQRSNIKKAQIYAKGSPNGSSSPNNEATDFFAVEAAGFVDALGVGFAALGVAEVVLADAVLGLLIAKISSSSPNKDFADIADFVVVTAIGFVAIVVAAAATVALAAGLALGIEKMSSSSSNKLAALNFAGAAIVVAGAGVGLGVGVLVEMRGSETTGLTEPTGAITTGFVVVVGRGVTGFKSDRGSTAAEDVVTGVTLGVGDSTVGVGFVIVDVEAATEGVEIGAASLILSSVALAENAGAAFRIVDRPRATRARFKVACSNDLG